MAHLFITFQSFSCHFLTLVSYVRTLIPVQARIFLALGFCFLERREWLSFCVICIVKAAVCISVPALTSCCTQRCLLHLRLILCLHSWISVNFNFFLQALLQICQEKLVLSIKIRNPLIPTTPHSVKSLSGSVYSIAWFKASYIKIMCLILIFVSWYYFN